MPEIKFGKHILELIVRTEDYPGILDNAFEIVTVSISNVVFVGELIGVSAKKIKDKETGEIEVWANIKLNVETIGTLGEATINHPGKNYEIEEHVDIEYKSAFNISNKTPESSIKSSDQVDFVFDD